MDRNVSTNINKTGIILACGAALLAVNVGFPPAGSHAESTVVVQAHAHIPTKLGVGASSDMSFGTLARPNYTSTEVLPPARGLSRGNPKSVVQEIPRVATIHIAANPGQTFGIAVDGSSRIGGNSRLLEISIFTHDAGATPVANARGRSEFRIGATLDMSVYTRSGIYNGSFDVIISNN